MKKLTAFIELHKSLFTRGIILAFLLIALPLTIYLNSQNQDNRQRAADTSELFCSFEEWKPVPDWLLGNNSLGSEKKRFPPDYFDEEKRDSIVPGPVIEAGQETSTYRYNNDGSLEYKVTHGGPLPVRYDPRKDIVRGEFSGRSYATSAWSTFIGQVNSMYYGRYSSETANRTISLGVVQKYAIMGVAVGAIGNLIDEKGGSTDGPAYSATQINKQIEDFYAGTLTVNNPTVKPYKTNDPNSDERYILVGQKVTLQMLSDVIGFDITNFDLRKKKFSILPSGGWNMQEEKDRMIAETASCTVIPTPKPTSSTPVSCDEQLMIPPVNFRKDFPSFTPNICPAHVANRDPGTNRNELDVCGEYWVTQWCNGNKQNATYACRGWSQTETNPVLLYYTNRIYAITTTKGTEGDGGQLAANIAKYGDVLGRRVTWNNFMKELKNGKIAYPWEHSSATKPAEEVRNNALNAASTAIFGKPWNFIKEQERMNNCSTTWDTPPTPSTSITPSVSLPPDGEDDQISVGDAKDIRPKVYKDKSGNIYIAWEVTEPENAKGINYAKGVWNGNKYTFPIQGTVGNTCASQGCAPAIAVNDTHIIITWAGPSNLMVAKYSKSDFKPQSVVPISQIGVGLSPNVAVDSQGRFHIVADGDFKTKYCIFNTEDNTCSTYKEIDTANSKPDIAIDSEDTVHIVAGKNGVHYLTLKPGESTFADKVISSGNGQQITADTSGNVHLVWSEDFDIHYCKKTINSDCTSSNNRVIQEENGTNPSIGVTDTGGILIAYNSGEQRMKYSKYMDGTWTQATTFGQQGATGVDISPISYDSKLSAVWSSDWDIWHRNFSFGDGTAFDLTLLLDGIGEAGDYTNRTVSDKSNKDPQHKNRSLAVQFFNEQNALVYTKIGTVSYNKELGVFKGIIPLGIDIAEGKYYTKVKMDQYLVKPLTFFSVKLGEVNVHPPLTLVTGDTDGNNELNLLDYNIIDGCYKDIKSSARSCDDELARLSDLNDDGKVNQLDYNLFVRELPAKKGQ